MDPISASEINFTHELGPTLRYPVGPVAWPGGMRVSDPPPHGLAFWIIQFKVSGILLTPPKPSPVDLRIPPGQPKSAPGFQVILQKGPLGPPKVVWTKTENSKTKKCFKEAD